MGHKGLLARSCKASHAVRLGLAWAMAVLNVDEEEQDPIQIVGRGGGGCIWFM